MLGGAHTLECKGRMVIEEKPDSIRERVKHDIVSIVRKMEAIPEEKFRVMRVDMRMANCAKGIRMRQLHKGCIAFAPDLGCLGFVGPFIIKAPG